MADTRMKADESSVAAKSSKRKGGGRRGSMYQPQYAEQAAQRATYREAAGGIEISVVRIKRRLTAQTRGVAAAWQKYRATA